MTSIHHHLALQVSDMERSIDFYLETLEAKVVTLPVTYDGERAAEVMHGEAKYRHCMLGFDPGILELFEFAPEKTPDWARDHYLRCVPHFGIVVDDVGAALAKVERAGGRRIWAHPHAWDTDPPTEIIYAADPDGNAFELLNAPIEDVIRRHLQNNPAANPTR